MDYDFETCPVCGRKVRDKEPYEKTWSLAMRMGLTDKVLQPFGLELSFPFGTVRLPGLCNHCDYARLQQFEREYAHEPRFTLL